MDKHTRYDILEEFHSIPGTTEWPTLLGDRLDPEIEKLVLAEIRRHPFAARIVITDNLRTKCPKDGVFLGNRSQEPHTVKEARNIKLFGLHAVTVVGYGSEDGVDYYIIMNSWGENWGCHGFEKVDRRLISCFYYPIIKNSQKPKED